MTQDIKTERRWLRAVIVASSEPLPTFPWMRGQRRRPQALTDQPAKTETPVERPVPVFHRPSLAAR